jgi:hypothetical protein
MQPQFLIDECLRERRLLELMNCSPDPIRFVRVGDPIGPPLGSTDSVLLAWTAEHETILVSHDRSTLAREFADLLNTGRHHPGLFLVRPGFDFQNVVYYLALVSHCSLAEEWQDRLVFVPE